MQSPLPIVAILVFYISFVLKVGPVLMKNRAPMKVDRIVMGYNVLQIFLNVAIFVLGLRIFPKMNIMCSPVDNTSNMLYLQYAYFLLKILDLADTIFFVLRKKSNQVTFLHIYHHFLMVSFTWVTTKFYVGGQVYFLGMPNLLVHIVMYFYYFLTSWDPVYKKSVWWKKHLTQMQIVQHCFIFVAFLMPLLNPSCTYPKFLLGVYLTQTIVMIVLFSDFYVKTYVKKNTKSIPF
ncbi:elongation of very long chain fatty acids protein 7-like, partial [Asbolus verrucosus]